MLCWCGGSCGASFSRSDSDRTCEVRQRCCCARSVWPSPLSVGQRMSRARLAIVFVASAVTAFQLPPLLPPHAAGERSCRSTPPHLSVSTAEESALLDSLKQRVAAVEDGAGRFYRVNALAPGFLNVHSTPGDPWRTDNVVCQLQDGAVVESLREEGVWINHDGGGWSIRVYEGHAFLVLVE